MSTRVKVRAGSYAYVETVVGRHQPAGGFVVDHDALPDVGVSVGGCCGHCGQTYLMHGLPFGGVRCDCCDDLSYGALPCARCGRIVLLDPVGE